MLNTMKKYEYRKFKAKKYNNVIESAHMSQAIRKLSGISVFVLEITSDNLVVSKFSIVGFMVHLLWWVSYLYSSYTVRAQSQNILGAIYKTQLQHYGDDFEWAATLTYFVYSQWKIPFSLSGNAEIMQEIVNIDLAIEASGDNVNYSKAAIQLFSISVGQIAVYFLRMICIWGTFKNLNVNVPIEKIFQVVCCDAVALITTAHFCYSLILLRCRLRWLNKTLRDIKSRKFDYKVLVSNKVCVNTGKVVKFEDRYICERMKACARIYGLLYKATESANRIFGLALVLTLFLYLNYVILYMFYFMEATASGLFRDVGKYVDFSIYFIWQLAYALGIIYLIVYFCESVTGEAAKVSFITHEIINSDVEQVVATEAMQFSTQLLHQRPIFTAAGLFKINYELLQQGGSAVVTYLIILLQFVVKRD